MSARRVETPHPDALAALLPEYTIRRLDRGSHRFGLYRDGVLVDAFAKSSNAESMLALLRGEVVDGHEGPRSRVYATAVVEFDDTRRRYVRAGLRPVSPPESLADRAERLAEVVRERTRAAARPDDLTPPASADDLWRLVVAMVAGADRVGTTDLAAALDLTGEDAARIRTIADAYPY